MSLWIPIRTKRLCDSAHDSGAWCVRVAAWEQVREPGDLDPPQLACDEHLPVEAEKEVSDGR